MQGNGDMIPNITLVMKKMHLLNVHLVFIRSLDQFITYSKAEKNRSKLKQPQISNYKNVVKNGLNYSITSYNML